MGKDSWANKASHTAAGTALCSPQDVLPDLGGFGEEEAEHRGAGGLLWPCRSIPAARGAGDVSPEPLGMHTWLRCAVPRECSGCAGAATTPGRAGGSGCEVAVGRGAGPAGPSTRVVEQGQSPPHLHPAPAGAGAASQRCQTPHVPKSLRKWAVRGHRLPLVSNPFPEAQLALLQGTPRVMEPSTAPVGAGAMPGCWHRSVPHGCWGGARLLAQVCPLSVCPAALTPQQRALPANKSRGAWPGQQPRSLRFPCPAPSLGQPGEQSPREGRDALTCPSPISQGCIWHRAGVYESFLLEKRQECSFLLGFPRPSEQALSMRSLGFLGNEQPPAESPTPPVLCFCSCQVLNVAVVVVVTTTSHFAFN